MAAGCVLLVFPLLLMSIRCDFAHAKHSMHEVSGEEHLDFVEYRVAVLEENFETLKTGANVKCGLPPSIYGSEVVYTSIHLNGVAKYSCRDGYVGQGSDISLCTDKGVWSPTDKTCCNVSVVVARWFGRMVYTGNVATTVTGKTCQRWKAQAPHRHSFKDHISVNPFGGETLDDSANYCRDPSGSGYLWCYTTDQNTRWEKCNIPRC
ncbi:hepatocyte growth factor-like protein [Haliotis rubra]|uniref:hepatocyte growth factor-like protein n=1 Tax=Haliotis rubra TaxID=36100 RepID=UPI001EE581D6|nr:hepatocyte growth factor-like protein [Haliotis rubra]